MTLRQLLRSKLPLPDFNHSLRWPLVISLSGVTLLVLTVIGLWFYLFTDHTEQREWQIRQQEAAENGATTVKDFIQARRGELVMIGELKLALTQLQPDFLDSFLLHTQDWVEIVHLDAKGHTAASATLTQELLNNPSTYPQSRWYQEAKAGRSYVGDFQFAGDNSPYLILSIPVSDGGVVAGRLRVGALETIVQQIHFGSTGRAYIINRNDGLLIAYPKTEPVATGTSMAGQTSYQAISSTPNGQWSGSYVNEQRIPVLGRSEPVTGTSWVLVTELSQAESSFLRKFAMAILLLALIAMWGLNTIITNRFLRRMIFEPVENLRQGAQIAGQGDLRHRIEVLRDDELGNVTNTFNDMIANLSEQDQRLRFAYDQAMEASRLKSELLSNVSHELRTPLGVIMGFAEMVRDGVYGPVTAEQQAPLATIINSSSGLNQLFNNMLDQAKLESHQVEVKIAPCQPEEILRPVKNRMLPLAKAKGLELITTISPDLPANLYGDSARLQQILINLIGNAIKFTQAGQINVCLYRPGPDHWAMQVTDTGCGIMPEAQHYIFEPFRQADGSSTREQNGAGLGLSIVKQLTDLMNGEILLTSEVGQGSSFTVLFPLLIGSRQTPEE